MKRNSERFSTSLAVAAALAGACASGPQIKAEKPEVFYDTEADNCRVLMYQVQDASASIMRDYGVVVTCHGEDACMNQRNQACADIAGHQVVLANAADDAEQACTGYSSWPYIETVRSVTADTAGFAARIHRECQP